MKNPITILLHSAFFLFSNCVSAQDFTVNIFEKKINKIAPQYRFIADTAGKLTIADIIKFDSSKFKTIPDSQKLAIPKITYWVEFEIINKNDENLVIEIIRDYDIIEFYWFDSEHKLIKEEYFSYSSIFSKKYFYINPLISIPYSNIKSKYYLKIRPSAYTGLGFTIFNSSFIYNKAIFKMLEIIVFLSILILIFFYNIIIGINLKDKIYFYYCLFIASLITFSLVLFGISHFIFKYLEYSYAYLTIPYASMTISLLLYSSEILETKKDNKLLFRIFQIAIFVRILIFIIGAIFNISFLHDSVIDLIILGVAIAGAFYRIIQGFHLGRYLLNSLIFIYISYGFHFLVNRGFIKFSYDQHQDSAIFFVLFSIIEVIFFSITLSQRIVKLRKEKEISQKNEIEYQSKLLASAKEKEVLQNQLTNELEKLVEKRTEELNKANQLLKIQAEEIEKMNSLLKEDNEKLSSDLENVNKARLLDTNLTFKEFNSNFPNEEICLQLVSELKWKDGYKCSKCNYKKYYFHNNTLARKCKLCGHVESPMVGTVLENVRFPIEKAMYLIYLAHSSKNINLTLLEEELDLRSATCSKFLKKIQLQTSSNPKNKSKDWISTIILED